MAIAVYQSPSACVDCEETITPVFGAVAEQQTYCPTTCGDGTVKRAIDVPMMPDGVMMKVDYFWQVHKDGDSAAAIDHMLNPVFQRLAWIKNCPIFVTTPLTNTVDPMSNMAAREGSGTMIGFAPEVGDLFLMRLEANTVYVFRVTESSPINASNPNTFTVDYQAVQTLDAMPALVDDLAHKVYEGDVYNFNLDKYLGGILPFESAEMQVEAKTVQDMYSQLTKDWEEYYDSDSACYVARFDTFRVYDPYVNDAMAKVLPYNRSGYRRSALRSLWSREISTYHTEHVNTPYNASNGLDTIRLYERALVTAKFSLSHIRHTSIEYIVLAGHGLPVDVGGAMSLVTGTTVHADGYLISPLYGTTDPARTIMDQLVQATHEGTVTTTLLSQAYAHYATVSVADKYWIIPALIQAIRSKK